VKRLDEVLYPCEARWEGVALREMDSDESWRVSGNNCERLVRLLAL